MSMLRAVEVLKDLVDETTFAREFHLDSISRTCSTMVSIVPKMTISIAVYLILLTKKSQHLLLRAILKLSGRLASEEKISFGMLSKLLTN